MKTLLLMIILFVSGCAWSEANQALDDFNMRLDNVQTTIDTQLEEGLITPDQAESATEKVSELKAGADLVDDMLLEDGTVDLGSITAAAVPLLPFPWNLIAIGIGTVVTAGVAKKVIG